MIEVSVVTPTYNRRMFIPTLIDIYKAQTFPKNKSKLNNAILLIF